MLEINSQTIVPVLALILGMLFAYYLGRIDGQEHERDHATEYIKAQNALNKAHLDGILNNRERLVVDALQGGYRQGYRDAQNGHRDALEVDHA